LHGILLLRKWLMVNCERLTVNEVLNISQFRPFDEVNAVRGSRQASIEFHDFVLSLKKRENEMSK